MNPTFLELHAVSLARKSLAGDSDAFAKLFDHLLPMAKKIAGEFPGEDFEEVIQLCRIALWERVLPCWEKNGFAGTLLSFAAAIFRHNVIEPIRTRKAKKRGGEATIEAIGIGIDVPTDAYNAARAAEEKEEENFTMDRILGQATTLGKQVAALLRLGFTTPQIDKILKLYRGKACKEQMRLKKQMKYSKPMIEQVNDANDIVATYTKVSDAARATAISECNIGSALRGEQTGRGKRRTHTSAGGYRWRYAKSRAGTGEK